MLLLSIWIYLSLFGRQGSCYIRLSFRGLAVAETLMDVASGPHSCTLGPLPSSYHTTQRARQRCQLEE